MAVVTSYTAERILELISVIPEIREDHEKLELLVAQLEQLVRQSEISRIEFQENVLPQLIAQINASTQVVEQVVDNTVVDLQVALDQNEQALTDLNTVTLPQLQSELDSAISASFDVPKNYVQPDEPTNPDEDGRELQVSDVWYDSDDGNKQRMWDGVEWTDFVIDVADFSIALQKLKNQSHLIDTVGTAAFTNTSVGSGITPI